MKLVASVPARNEYDRYLFPFLDHLLKFCDEIRLLNDWSDDHDHTQMGDVIGMYDDRLQVGIRGGLTFFEHEGQFRNELLAWTLEGEPTHILAIDADEFVSDGSDVRAACEGPGDVFTLQMQEVWKADEENLWIRVDGGWRRRQVPILYRVPQRKGRDFSIANRALACGREPQSVAKQALRGLAKPAGEVLHFGWSRESERQARYDRYAEHDKGRFHANQHLQSILWPDSKVTLEPREWPEGLNREAILG